MNTIFTALPKSEDLCCIRCTFTKHQMTHEIIANVKHCQTICCRDIIRNFPEVIAAPIPDTQNYALIVMTKDFYRTEKLQQYLSFSFIGYSSLQTVTTKILKLCLKNTIKCKLSPTWNKCHEYLCAGQNFIDSTHRLDAVKLELNVEEEELTLKFTSYKMQIHPLKLKSAQTIPKITFILPSLHKCKMLEVKRRIPQNCPFKKYEVFRDHWMHMYGIKLPTSSTNIHYCLVQSSEAENPIFFCPDVCLQVSLPTVSKLTHDLEIKNRFLNDLREKIPQIFGKEVSFKDCTPGSTANSVQLETPKTPRKSLVKNPCFNSTSNTPKTFNYDPKNLKSLLFQMNVTSPTKSLSSYGSSFSFQNTMTSKNSRKPEVSGTYSKDDFVKNWLLNSCSSEVSSLNDDSSNSKEEFDKLKELPIESKQVEIKEIKKPSVRSIENVNFSLSEIKKRRKI